VDVEIKRKGVFTDADGFAKVIHYWKIFNLFDFALNLALRKVTCQWRFRLSFPCQHTYKCAYYSQYQDWLTKSVLGICQSWRWLYIWAWSNKILMLFPSWIRKMNIVLFEQDALSWSTRVFFEILKYRSYNFVDVKVMWQHPWVKFGCVF
jgi:hypothetical protein